MARDSLLMGLAVFHLHSLRKHKRLGIDGRERERQLHCNLCKGHGRRKKI